MKMLIKVLKVFGILLLIITAISFIFFSSHIHVERTAEIPNSKHNVYNYLIDFHNFNQWSPWYEMDTTAKYSYSGQIKGEGSVFMWESEKKDVGKGSMTITGLIPDSAVLLDLSFDGQSPAQSSYRLTSAGDNKTMMTWSLDFEAGANPIFRIMGAFMDKMMEKDFNRGFEKLKAVMANYNPAAELSIELVDVKPFTYLYVKDSADVNNISQKLGNGYGLISKLMAEQKLQFAGAPFAIYYNDSETNWTFDAAIPYTGKAKESAIVKTGSIKDTKAVVAHFYGSYDKTSAAHSAAREYIAKRNLQINGYPWESYITDPMTEKDTAKWQTDVYYPVVVK